jgi:D-alanyl-D-alanine carboxypeptidase (penicillin-binding protein 5/6)
MNCQEKNGLLCFFWFVVVCAALLPIHASSQSEPSIQNNTHAIFQPKEISVNAKSAILMDADTGQILVEYNKYSKIPPASFAKILTLYIVFDAIKQEKLAMEDEVYISKKAWKTKGSRMFIEVDSKIQTQELIKGIAVVSGNDACVALAEHIYGSTDIFVKTMNETAQRIGMKNSSFKTPHGLPKKQQYTTAYDMALIARSYIQNFPEALQFHSMQEYTYGDIRQYNRNGLLRRDPTVDGLKTGYTVKSGYHLLATAKRGKRRLIAVVMGAKTRAIREREAQKLLNYGYQNFELLPLFTDGQVLAEIPVWKGAKDTVSLVTAGSGVMTVPVEYKKDIREEREVPNQVIAPIEQGQVIGKVIIKLKAEIIKSVSLVAQHKVGKAGLVKSFSHSMYLLGKSHAGLFVVFLLIMMSVPIGYFFFATRRRKRRRSGFRF